MINLRYHIVSITAVFLALGIGVALGSTLIERATVDTLETRLDEQEERLDETDTENARLRDEIERRDELDERLTEVGPARLFAGHLADVPVTLIARRGTDLEALTELESAVRAADARVQGTLWFTDRWDDIGDDDVADLSEILGIGLGSPDVARQIALRRVSAELAAAAAPEPPEPEPEPVTPTTEPPTVEAGAADPGAAAADVPGQDTPPTTVAPTTTTTAPPPPPDRGDLIDELIAGGWLEFDPDAASSPLPTWGARYVVVADGAPPAADDEPVLAALLAGLGSTTATPSAVVAGLDAEPSGTDETVDADEIADDEVAALVARVRADERLAARVSTVDHVLGFEGLAALVLALEDLALPRIGHYGIAASAGALLPPAQP